jgi:hypothetical protein
MSDNYVLQISLATTVPIWIGTIASWSDERRRQAASEVANVIAAHGDDLMFGGKHCADAFNKLALGIACLAYAPGGVRFMGEHWQADQSNPAGGTT